MISHLVVACDFNTVVYDTCNINKLECVILCFVVRYSMSILVLQSILMGKRESWLLCA